MSKALAMMKVGASLGPIYPQSIEDAYRLAKMAFTAGMLKPQRVNVLESVWRMSVGLLYDF